MQHIYNLPPIKLLLSVARAPLTLLPKLVSPGGTRGALTKLFLSFFLFRAIGLLALTIFVLPLQDKVSAAVVRLNVFRVSWSYHFPHMLFAEALAGAGGPSRQSSGRSDGQPTFRNWVAGSVQLSNALR